MTTKRTRRARNRRAPLDPGLIRYLKDDEGAKFPYFATDDEIRAAWNELRDSILADWTDRYPGTRPLHWWKFEAPEPRQRLGGTGSPAHEVLAYVPEHAFGIPVSWVSQWDADYYNGRARDVNGQPIGTEYEEGHFAGVPIDPEDQPLYESEPQYLQRLGLLLPGELERLSPADFEPEAVEGDPDEDEPPDQAA